MKFEALISSGYRQVFLVMDVTPWASHRAVETDGRIDMKKKPGAPGTHPTS